MISGVISFGKPFGNLCSEKHRFTDDYAAALAFILSITFFIPIQTDMSEIFPCSLQGGTSQHLQEIPQCRSRNQCSCWFWYNRKKPSPGVKTAEKGIKQGLSRSNTDFGSPFPIYSVTDFLRFKLGYTAWGKLCGVRAKRFTFLTTGR